MRAALAAVLPPALLLAAAPALACSLPADGGETPWRRAVAKVKYLPETEAMVELQARDRNVVQYIVLLDAPRQVDGRCHWPVEVRVEGRLWKRFLVTPDGGRVVEDRTR
jgi:hypothetical protein